METVTSKYCIDYKRLLIHQPLKLYTAKSRNLSFEKRKTFNKDMSSLQNKSEI